MLIALFSQYMTNVKIPVPAYAKDRGGCYIGRYPLFQLFPVSMYEKFREQAYERNKSSSSDFLDIT